MGNLFPITGRIKCRTSLPGRKNFSFYLKILLLSSKGKYREKTTSRSNRFFSYCLCVCVSLSFVLTWCCVLTWVKEMLMRAILNVHAGRLWPAGSRFSTRDLDWYPHDHENHFATNYYVSPLYSNCKGVRLRRILSNELVEVTHGLCHSVNVCFWKKSATKNFTTPHFLHAKSLMIVSRSVSPRIPYSMPRLFC